ncbi:MULTISPECIES: glycosyltransferase family 4 protein [unclassified Massilia]|uniref:glycosyltransferase family 4 protein n=1 Tax=unclassified Massilia TaxID=2609279 RepID=UPI0009E67DAE|nr:MULTISPECIES: glycosyltransferase family 4 protein [unclassified Massilia]
MKILMVSEDLPGTQIGGLGKHVVTLSNALLEQGHEVDIMGRSDRLHADSASEIGFRGRLLPGFGFERPGWKESQLGFFNPVKRPWFARRVARALLRVAGKYDVVHYHGHLPMAGRYVPDGVNFVQSRHDQGSECVTHLRFRQEHVCETRDVRDCAACIHPAPNGLRRTVSGLAVRRYRSETAESFARHKTVFVSDFLRRAFLRAVPDADLSRARVIHNFIRYSHLREHAAAPHEVRTGEVMLVGRIDSGKGFGEFLAQVQGWLPQHARVTIIGDGPLRPALEAKYAGPQVRFLGWQPYDEVIRLSARSHVLVVPSVCEEACSTTVLEALALGKPCLALARGGTPELATYQYYDGQLGLAQTMPRLVERLVELLGRAPVTVPLPASFPMDVSSAIPRILDFYAE